MALKPRLLKLDPFSRKVYSWPTQTMEPVQASSVSDLSEGEDFRCLVSSAEYASGFTVPATRLEEHPFLHDTLIVAFPGMTQGGAKGILRLFAPELDEEDLAEAVESVLGDYHAELKTEDDLPAEFFGNEVWDVDIDDIEKISKFVTEWGVPMSPLRYLARPIEPDVLTKLKTGEWEPGGDDPDEREPGADDSDERVHDFDSLGEWEPGGDDPDEREPGADAFGKRVHDFDSLGEWEPDFYALELATILSEMGEGIAQTDKLRESLKGRYLPSDAEVWPGPPGASLKPEGPIVAVSLAEVVSTLKLIRLVYAWTQTVVIGVNSTNKESLTDYWYKESLPKYWFGSLVSQAIIELLSSLPPRRIGVDYRPGKGVDVEGHAAMYGNRVLSQNEIMGLSGINEAEFTLAIFRQYIETIIDDSHRWKICGREKCGRAFKFRHSKRRHSWRTAHDDSSYCSDKCMWSQEKSNSRKRSRLQ